MIKTDIRVETSSFKKWTRSHKHGGCDLIASAHACDVSGLTKRSGVYVRTSASYFVHETVCACSGRFRLIRDNHKRFKIAVKVDVYAPYETVCA